MHCNVLCQCDIETVQLNWSFYLSDEISGKIEKKIELCLYYVVNGIWELKFHIQETRLVLV